MALQTLGAQLLYPGYPFYKPSASLGMGSHTILNAAAEYHAVVLAASEAMAISHVGFFQTAVGSPVVDTRIETVATDGLPSGTLWATNTNKVSAALTTGWTLQALTATANIAAGQTFCCKILYQSGTSCTLGNLTAGLQSNFPYKVVNTGTPTKSGLIAHELIVFGSSATNFYNIVGFVPEILLTPTTFNNSVAGAKRGMRFQIPFKCRCNGIHWAQQNAVGNFNVLMMDDAGTELSSTSTAYDGDHTGGGSSGSSMTYPFDNPVTLSPATWYRLVMEPTSTTNVQYLLIDLPSADYVSATSWGENAHFTTFTTGGGWVDSATSQVIAAGLIIDQLDDGVGGGGGGSTAHVIGG